MLETIKQQLLRNYHGGCVDLAPDGSEYSLQQFGGGEIGKAPEKEFEVPNRPPVKDQGSTDFCVAFQASYTVEQDFGLKLSSPFNFAMAKRRYYGNHLGFGLSIKHGLGSLQKDGICSYDLFPMTSNRNYMANWKSISSEAIEDAKKRRMKKGYFVVDSFPDKFDNFLSGMYNWNEPVITGLTWYSGFYTDNKGRLVMNKKGSAVGHAFGAYKSVIVEGEQRIEFQNSYNRMPIFSMNREQCRELFYGYIVLPIDRPIVDIIKKYAGKIVRSKDGRPPMYLIQGGKKRHFENENMLNLYGVTLQDYTEVPSEELSQIPDGDKIGLGDLTPAMVQLLKRNNL